MARVVINVCFGGFGLSDAAYEWLASKGVPVRKYIKQERGEDGLFLDQPANDGEVIFDRDLTPLGEDSLNDIYHRFKPSNAQNRYWDCWTRENRTHPLVIACVEALGEAANGRSAELKIVDVPEGVEWEISEYDGNEHVAEKHRSWS